MIIRSPWASVAGLPRVPGWEFLRRTASILPNKPALIEHTGQTWSYAKLWSTTQSVAAYLRHEAGIKPGDCVAITAEGSGHFAAAMFGAQMAGAVVTPLTPVLSERDLTSQLLDSNASLIISPFPARILVEAVLAQGAIPAVRALYRLEELESWAGKATPTNGEQASDWSASDVALLAYTSGTESERKGAMLTIGGIATSIHLRITTAALTPDVVLLDMGPKWFTFGWIFAVGATAIEPLSAEPDELLQHIQNHQVTHITTRPFVVETLLGVWKNRKRDVSSVQFIETSGLSLPAELANRAERVFGFPVSQQYSLTETTGPANRSMRRDVRLGSVGPPLPDTEERIVDIETGEDVPVGETGELLVRGPQLMKGYWRRPEESARVFTLDGWLRTGDIARCDVDGHVYIVDRAKEIIKVYGRQVVSAEVEDILLRHPAVREAAVIRIPSVEAGEVPKAFVVLQLGLDVTAQELIAFVARASARYKAPGEVEFVSAIPKGPSGKVLRRVLVELERAKRGEPSGTNP